MRVVGCLVLVTGVFKKVPRDEETVVRYDDHLIKQLGIMSQRMTGWTNVCLLCEDESGKKKEKFQPSVRVNMALDRLSAQTKKKITGPKESWSLFISSYAYIYYIREPISSDVGGEM